MSTDLSPASQPEIGPINPPDLAAPIGFAHGVATRGGRILWLAGQNGMDAEGRIVAPGDIAAQTDLALANILAVVAAAGGGPEDVVKLHFYVSDVPAYRAARRSLGAVWRKHFGKHYPAMMLLGVTGFFEADALIEIDGYAVIDDAVIDVDESG
jgi:enamine deaminase RidA (YjgF/YER057c/UK114 family)